MSKKLAGPLAVYLFVTVVLAMLGPGVNSASAQGNSDKVVVIHESKHDKHALGPEDLLPYPGGRSASNHEKVLLQAHAPGIMRKMQDPALQTSIGPTVATTSGANFAGVGANGWAPPDTNGAAGATQYVQWVNVEFAAFDKATGTMVYGPFLGNSIWSKFGGQCENNNSGDPIAQYDKQAGRWVLMQAAFSNPYTICIAVSTTSTWTNSGMTWNLYAFAVPNSSSNFPDYPKLSIWPDGYYLSYNSFTNGNSWAGPQACVMDRTNMLLGNAATMQCAKSSGSNLLNFISIDSWLPSDLDGAVPGVSGTTQAPPAGSPAYYVGIYGGSNSELALFSFHVDWTTPSNSTFTGPTYFPVNPFNEACGGGTCIPQPNTSQTLDSLADRLMYRLAYRNFGDHEALVVSHSVDPGTGRSGIRWYEIRSPGSSPSVSQQGTFAPSDTSYRWMPSIAMDKNGDIAVGYSESSSTVAPSIFYTGRLAGDPGGTMESEAPILKGAFSQTSGLSRWGDYSAMSVDPADDCTFWYTNEFLPSNGTFNWATQIASFVFPGCTGPPTPGFNLTVTPPTSQTVIAGNPTSYSLNVNPTNTFTGNVNLSVTSAPITGVGVGFIPNPANVTSSSSVPVTMNVTTSGSTPAGNYTITVQGTNGSLNSSTSVTLIVNVPTFTLTSNGATSQKVTAGSNATYPLALTPFNGFTGTVGIGISGQPAGVTFVNPPPPSPSVTMSGTNPTDFNLILGTTAGTTPVGTYTIKVTGTSGSLSSSTSVTLQITPAGTISLSNPTTSLAPLTIHRGKSGTITITVQGAGGFSGSVALSISGLPSKVTASFNPTSVTLATNGSKTSVLTLKVNPSAKTGGPATLTVTGKDSTGTITNTTKVYLTIN